MAWPLILILSSGLLALPMVVVGLSHAVMTLLSMLAPDERIRRDG